jgi:hemolysin III
VALYLLMGWVGLMALIPAADGVALAGPTIVLAAVGGGLYTAGVAFFLWESLPYHNAIWHGFVLVATFVFYGAVLTEIGLRASAMA